MNSPPLSAWPFVFREVYSGTSVCRALMHVMAKAHLEVSGIVVDIGGGRRQSYLRRSGSEPARVVTIDIEPGPQVDVVASATSMPLDRASVDTVICFNVLEHIYDYRSALVEICRVMRPDGRLFGWVPFIIGFHGAPDDYFRYTASSLRRLLDESELEPIGIVYCGNVFLSAFDLLRPYIRGWFIGRLLRVCGLALALVVHQLHSGVVRIRGRSARAIVPCPSGIWFVAKPRKNDALPADNVRLPV